MDNQATVTHTPGPWKLPVIENLTDQGDNYRCLSAGKGYFESETGRGFLLYGFISESDANLIVAAPDLLEACRYMHRLLTDMGYEGFAGPILGDNAIRKAEGRA